MSVSSNISNGMRKRKTGMLTTATLSHDVIYPCEIVEANAALLIHRPVVGCKGGGLHGQTPRSSACTIYSLVIVDGKQRRQCARRQLFSQVPGRSAHFAWSLLGQIDEPRRGALMDGKLQVPVR